MDGQGKIPPHPGEIIRNTCMEPRGLSVTRVAKALGITRKSFSELLNGHNGLSPEMAIRLSIVFGDTPENWLNYQFEYDLWRAKQRVAEKPLRVEQLSREELGIPLQGALFAAM